MKFTTLLFLSMVLGQEPEAFKPESFVSEWFKRWNALDGSAATTDKFLELYHPTAMHQASPTAKQIGPVFFEASAGIRKMAEDFGKTNTDAAYRVETVTANELSKQLYYVTQGPWGGPAISVEFVGAYTVRDTKKRYMFPGVAVFHLKDGKILYARVYSTRDELTEIRP